MRRFLRGASLATAGLILAAAVQAQEPFKPTDQHRELAKEAGTWDVEIKLFLQGPGAPPDTARGVQETELLPGGLWLASKFEGEVAGRASIGRGLSGYDPAKKKIVEIWVNSNDPHPTIMEGDYDPATKTVTSFGKSTDPRSGKPYDVKTTTVVKGDDERAVSYLIKNADTGGEYYKLMEMTLKRRGK